MLEVLAAASLALGAAQTSPNDHLVTCLASLSRAPEYAARTDEQIAQDDAFFEAAAGRYCSDEAYPLWRIAHDRARKALGLKQGAPTTREQQELAEKEMRSLLGEAWSKVGERRAKTQLPANKLESMMLNWLLDGAQAPLFDQVEAPVLCSQGPIRQTRQLSPKDIRAGMASPTFRKIGERCGYPAVQAKLVQALLNRFPDASVKLAERVAVSFMGQMTFEGALSQ